MWVYHYYARNQSEQLSHSRSLFTTCTHRPIVPDAVSGAALVLSQVSWVGAEAADVRKRVGGMMGSLGTSMDHVSNLLAIQEPGAKYSGKHVCRTDVRVRKCVGGMMSSLGTSMDHVSNLLAIQKPFRSHSGARCQYQACLLRHVHAQRQGTPYDTELIDNPQKWRNVLNKLYAE